MAEPGTTATAARRTGAPGERLDRTVMVLAAVLVLGTFMTLLDATAVNVALAAIRGDFGSPLTMAQWVITGYLLATAAVVPVTGWAVGRFGTKTVWLASLGVFTLGSLLCGTSWSLGSLIGFRVLQGLGGGMIVPVAHTVLARAAGPRRLGRAMSVLSMTTTLGPIAGPVLGGGVVQWAGWHWIFYANVPVGCAAMAAAVRFLPDTPGGTSPHRLDACGLLLCSGGVSLLVWGLSAAGGQGGSADPGAWGAALGGAVLLVLFGVRGVRGKREPVISLRLFRNRDFLAASAFLFLVTTALFGAVLLIPLFCQMIRGGTSLSAGLLVVPQGLGVAFAIPLAGNLTDRYGPRTVVLPGLLLTVLGTLVFTRATPNTPLAVLDSSLVIRGVGIGCMMMPASAAAYVSLPARDLAQAAGTTTLLRCIGSSFGTALPAVILAGGLRHREPTDAFHLAFWAVLALSVLCALPAALLASGMTRGDGGPPRAMDM